MWNRARWSVRHTTPTSRCRTSRSGPRPNRGTVFAPPTLTSSPYRNLPAVDRLLAEPRLAALAGVFGQPCIAHLAREALEAARAAIGAGEPAQDLDQLAAAVEIAAARRFETSFRTVINATGVVLQTNLGRAPVSQQAAAAMAAAAAGYSNLEYDLAVGERGSRHGHLELLLTEITGAEAAMVVNNNAAAVLLGLMAVAADREVVVSRGQAVEIGGGFRIPDVLRQSGAKLVEVGTTNRTYLEDYDAALTHESAALLRVHTSNFRVIGFTHETTVAELASLARRRGLQLLDDLGSGCLLDTSAYGLAKEPMPQESIAAGADLVFFSGDKLLGGPQAGIIAGRRDTVDRLKRHPLARALRIDKATLAGLAVTLSHYLRNEAEAKVPVWQMIARPLAQLDAMAREWAGRFPGRAIVEEGRSMIGGGSLPEESLPTRLVAFPASSFTGRSLTAVASALRTGSPPVVARVERNRLLLDPRTVLPGEEPALLRGMEEVVNPS